MKGYIEERAVKTAEYIIETKATVRQTARKFGVSKSTVHKDVTARLTRINPALANEARKVLDVNKKRAPYPRRIGNARKIPARTVTAYKMSRVPSDASDGTGLFCLGRKVTVILQQSLNCVLLINLQIHCRHTLQSGVTGHVR